MRQYLSNLPSPCRLALVRIPTLFAVMSNEDFVVSLVLFSLWLLAEENKSNTKPLPALHCCTPFQALFLHPSIAFNCYASETTTLYIQLATPYYEEAEMEFQ